MQSAAHSEPEEAIKKNKVRRLNDHFARLGKTEQELLEGAARKLAGVLPVALGHPNAQDERAAQGLTVRRAWKDRAQALFQPEGYGPAAVQGIAV